MRASVLRDGRMVYRDDVPEPVPGPGQVLVGVRACGICGSDLHFAKHGKEMLSINDTMEGMPNMGGGGQVDLSDDIFMGHEFAAEIIEPGPDTDAPAPGTLVTSFPILMSAKGIEPIVYSNTTLGGYAERMLLSAPLLMKIPSGVDPRHAALTEPMAVGLHAVNKSGIERGEKALVLGCGPIGIAIIAALRLRGVETIVASDYSPRRRDIAAAMGAHQTVDAGQGSPFDGIQPAVVFEAIGVPGIINDILRRAPMGTRVVVAGVCMQQDTVLPFFAIAKEINIQFVVMYDQNELNESLRAIADGDIDATAVITRDVGLEDVGNAFDDLADPDRHCGILWHACSGKSQVADGNSACLGGGSGRLRLEVRSYGGGHRHAAGDRRRQRTRAGRPGHIDRRCFDRVHRA
jgi:2-desacetyl-2-hydroxyethyl bacteriochlorophyllide A dehydrogenase